MKKIFKHLFIAFGYIISGMAILALSNRFSNLSTIVFGVGFWCFMLCGSVLVGIKISENAREKNKNSEV